MCNWHEIMSVYTMSEKLGQYCGKSCPEGEEGEMKSRARKETYFVLFHEHMLYTQEMLLLEPSSSGDGLELRGRAHACHMQWPGFKPSHHKSQTKWN